MGHASRTRWTVIVPLAGYAVGTIVAAFAAWGSVPVQGSQVALENIILFSPPVVLGLLVIWKRPESAAGPALLVLGAAPMLTTAVETWGSSFTTTDPWPLARLGATLATGVWVFHLAGFVLLCLVFPNGVLPGRRWAALPWVFLGVAVAVAVVVMLLPDQYATDGGELPGHTPLRLPDPLWDALIAVAGLSLLGVLGSAVAALVVRYRRGSELTRLQLRWVMLGAGSVPALLAGGWVAEAFGAPIAAAYSPFLAAIVFLLPATVAFAILRHDLFDIDRLLSASVAWLLTAAVAAGVFALVVLAGVELARSGDLVADSRPAIVAGAFITALLLIPLHRWLHNATARVLDRERTVMTASIQEFVRRVRDGEAQPEAVQDVLRTTLDDPALEVLLKAPGEDGFVDLTGVRREPPPAATLIPLTARDAEIAMIVLGRVSARRLRWARDMAVEARLPIEVSRLRMELHGALDDARASRARLVEAAASERQRLERDLHDGAQQHILAVGMRLRAIQRQRPLDNATSLEIDAAVAGLEDTVTELRRLAHGVRPMRLDDGLEAAIQDLARDSAIPIEVRVGDFAVSEAVATTAYFVVAESLANTMKHAGAANARVTLNATDERLTVEVSDDGCGGALAGSGLTALRDRVRALGGDLELLSPAGGGTTIRAVL
jgi:signal transduction histidine kinase